MRSAAATTLNAFLFVLLHGTQLQHVHAEVACTPSCWINEFHYDNVDTDTGEFVEIACTPDVDLSQWSLYLYNGDTATNGVLYGAATQLNSTDISVTRSACVDGLFYVVVNYTTNGLQNGPRDGFALVRTTPPSTIEFLSYEGVMTAGSGQGPASGQTSTDVRAEEILSTVVGTSVSRFGKGCSASAFSTWVAGLPETKGSNNLCLQQVTGCCVQCPTPSPSAQPSSAPSSIPSAQPSSAPSSIPSVQPSHSAQPSRAPSSAPSARPSKSKKSMMMMTVTNGDV